MKYSIGSRIQLKYTLKVGILEKGIKAKVVNHPPLSMPIVLGQEMYNNFLSIEWEQDNLKIENGFYDASFFELVEQDKILVSQPTITSNEGRIECFKCSKPTIQVDGFMKKYTICPDCKI